MAILWQASLCGCDCRTRLTPPDLQADSLTEEQVSEFKEAFSLFVSRILFGMAGYVLTPQLQDKDGDGMFTSLHTQ